NGNVPINPSPPMYWMDGGIKIVTVETQAGGRMGGEVTVKRPEGITVKAFPGTVDIFPLAGGVVVSSGTLDDKAAPIKAPGIRFLREGSAPTEPGGFQWVQLIDRTYRYNWITDDGQELFRRYDTEELALDKKYPYSRNNPTDDTPSTSLS